jgi:hypothetical protein
MHRALVVDELAGTFEYTKFEIWFKPSAGMTQIVCDEFVQVAQEGCFIDHATCTNGLSTCRRSMAISAGYFSAASVP